jgi:hypothetical protein
MGQPVLLNYLASFIYHSLSLDIQWGHADAWNILDFDEREGEGVTVKHIPYI